MKRRFGEDDRHERARFGAPGRDFNDERDEYRREYRQRDYERSGYDKGYLDAYLEAYVFGLCLLCMYFTRGKLLREARATVTAAATVRSWRLLLEIVERGQNRRLRDGRAEAIADLAPDEVTVPKAHEHFLWRSSLFAPPGELCRVVRPRHVPTARRLDVPVENDHLARSLLSVGEPLRSRRLLLEIVKRGQHRRLRDGRAEAIADLAPDEVTVPKAHEHFLWPSALFAPPGELCRVVCPRHVPTARRLDVPVENDHSARKRLDLMRERTREELVEVALQRRVLRRALLEFRQPSAVAVAENTAPPTTDAARNLCTFGPLPFDHLESRISPEDNERVLGFSKFVRQLLDPFGVGSNSKVGDEAHPVLATQETDDVVCLNRGFARESREISIAPVRVFRDA